MNPTTRKLLTADPFTPPELATLHRADHRWPAKWVCHPGQPRPPFVTSYRCAFSLTEAASIDIHLTADERYDLYLDGEHLGKGPERGDPKNWFYETYTLDLKPGDYILVARVWSLGQMAPMAQMSFAPGFLLAAADPFTKRLSTGQAQWECKILNGYTFTPGTHWLRWVGAQNTLDAAHMDWGFEKGEGDNWKPVIEHEPGLSESISDAFDYDPAPHLRFATLPPMLQQPRSLRVARFASDVSSQDTHLLPIRAAKNNQQQQKEWNDLTNNKSPLTIPPHSKRRVLFDLEDYVCAYPQVTTSGGAGALVRVFFAESLINQPDPSPDGLPNKGDRNAVEDKLFHGIGDEFKPDGKPNRTFQPLWWRPGRYVEVYVETRDEPLTINELALIEDRYPLEVESKLESSDARFTKVVPIMRRALEVCMHETYMDCPYFEQLMYVGDTRLQMLTTYALTRDDRLPRKAVNSFARSRLPSGLTQSRFPSRITQIIPTFSLWWIGMLHDFAMWRGDLPMIRSLMPNARNVIDFFLTNVNKDGLLVAPVGWNFVDWVPGWKGGVPPDGDATPGGTINWQFIYTLNFMAELERWAGEDELAARCARHAKSLAARASEFFWNDQRNLLSEDAARKHFSEHTQSLALLSNHLPPDKSKSIAAALVADEHLDRTTIYFTHYLFEAYRIINKPDKIIDRMKLWFDLPAQGFKTTPESPEPTRSDCHAWGAHPIYHYFASLMGIRPASPGFETVRIEPRLGPLTKASGKLAHPRGFIEIEVEGDPNQIAATITLPENVAGEIAFNDQTQPLKSGKQKVRIG